MGRDLRVWTMDIPVELHSANQDEHGWARSARRKRERMAVRYAWLRAGIGVVRLPVDVRLVRLIGPRQRPWDGDNLQRALKSIRDELADCLGTDDAPSSPVTWLYDQYRAGTEPGVRVTIAEVSSRTERLLQGDAPEPEEVES